MMWRNVVIAQAVVAVVAGWDVANAWGVKRRGSLRGLEGLDLSSADNEPFPPQPFLLLPAVARSGSSWLGELLYTHPNITWAGEYNVLGSTEEEKLSNFKELLQAKPGSAYIRKKNNVGDVADNIIRPIRGAKEFAVKAHENPSDFGKLLHVMKREEGCAVFLERKNIIAGAYSAYVMFRVHEPCSMREPDSLDNCLGASGERIKLPVQELVKRSEKQRHAIEAWFGSEGVPPIPTLRVEYEKLDEDPERELARVYQFLTMECPRSARWHMTTADKQRSLAKVIAAPENQLTYKLHGSTPVRDKVSNWHEIEAAARTLPGGEESLALERALTSV